ncbi:NosD domain-containing protein [Algoriphagus zhangzhouensis]|uniref:Periplasmic copper-binding protein NosD beta helix domain-containing protein n=1 Tax=Algoriphagus zhangzhouensis TaxID=1073327 RepID=A0A1M7ZEM8_9BACT|nr:right-handed parallel beta-helix repeat-containing protein [Algoriphagus zhangzhouensis]TDY46078.1 hypothetical protein A8938_2685 [Algoriphagus zhangzhouensis]SHO63333.1 hypothetical protein SAMN04488108_2682 [Algoriphagus zhangzhouensis]
MNYFSFLFFSLLVLLTLGNTNQKSTQEFFYPSFDNFGDTLYVDPPTGLFDEDRELIISTLKLSKPGDVILFSPGTYRIGSLIDLDVPELTLIGHEEGTIIRGCEPDEMVDIEPSIFGCGGFELIADSQTIKNFTFEYAWHGIIIGCCMPKNIEEAESGSSFTTTSYGGHIIENNTFRNNPTGIRVTGNSPIPTKISNNIFHDNYHGLTINGGNVTVENNHFFSKEPTNVPIDHVTHNAIGVWPYEEWLTNTEGIEKEKDCTNNYILNNYIENLEIGIEVYGNNPDELEKDGKCGTTIVQGNKIVN